MSTAARTRKFVPETANNRLIRCLECTHRGRLTFQCSVHAANATKQLQNVPMGHCFGFSGEHNADVGLVRVSAVEESITATQRRNNIFKVEDDDSSSSGSEMKPPENTNTMSKMSCMEK